MRSRFLVLLFASLVLLSCSRSQDPQTSGIEEASDPRAERLDETGEQKEPTKTPVSAEGDLVLKIPKGETGEDEGTDETGSDDEESNETPPESAPSATEVIGSIDRLNLLPDGNALLSGWACERTVGQSIMVHVYVDTILLKAAPANLASEPSISSSCETTGIAHRFEIPFSPGELSPYRGRALTVYGISVSGGENKAISNSAVTRIPQEPPAYPAQVIGQVDSIGFRENAYFISGWACDKRVAAPISVHVYAGGPAGFGSLVKGAPANQSSEPAVSTECQTTGVNHRFDIRLEMAELAAFRGQKIFIHGISLWGAENALINNSGTFTVPSGNVAGFIDDFILMPNGEGVIAGWACDQTIQSSISVHVYADKSASEGGFLLAGGSAANPSEQAVSDLCRTRGVPHRFSVPIPAGTLSAHRGQKLFVHGISALGGENKLIERSGDSSIPLSPNNYRAEIKGNIDGVLLENNTYFLIGWACDAGIAASTQIHVYVKGAAGTGVGTLLKAALANIPNEQAVSTECGTSGVAHRFKMRFEPGELAAHQGKKIDVYGISLWGGVNRQLANSGRFVIPAPIQNYYLDQVQGAVDGIWHYQGEDFLSGWACDTAVPASIAVHLYVGGPAGSGGTAVMAAPADVPSEPAVSQACQTSGVAHRFNIRLDDSTFSAHAGKKIYVYGISAMGGTNRPLVQSGRFTIPRDFTGTGNRLLLGLPFRAGEPFPVLSGSTPDGMLAFATDYTAQGSLLFVPLIQPGSNGFLPEASLTDWYAWEGRHVAQYTGAPALQSDQSRSFLGFAYQGAIGFDPRYGTQALRVDSPTTCVDHENPAFYSALSQTGRYLCYKLIVFNPGNSPTHEQELFHSRISVVVESFDGEGHPLSRPRVISSRFHQNYVLVTTPASLSADNTVQTHYGLEVSVSADSRLLIYNRIFDIEGRPAFAMASFSERPWEPNQFQQQVKLRDLSSFYGNKMICLTPDDPACVRVKLSDVYPIARSPLKEPLFGEPLFAHKDNYRCAYAWITPDSRNVFCAERLSDQFVVGADTEFNLIPTDGPGNGFLQRYYPAFGTFVFQGQQIGPENTFGMFPSVYEKRTQMPLFIGQDSGMWRAFPQSGVARNFRVNQRPHSTQLLYRSGKFETFNPNQNRAVFRGVAALEDSATFAFTDVNFNSFRDPHFLGYYTFMNGGYRGGSFVRADGSVDADYAARIQQKVIDVSGNYNYLERGPGAWEDDELAALQPDTLGFYFSQNGFLGHGLHFISGQSWGKIRNGTTRPIAAPHSELSVEFAFRINKEVPRDSRIRLLELTGGLTVEIAQSHLSVQTVLDGSLTKNLTVADREVRLGRWNHFGFTFQSRANQRVFEIYLNGERVLEMEEPSQGERIAILDKQGYAGVVGPNGVCDHCGSAHFLSLDELAISDVRRNETYFRIAALNPPSNGEALPPGFPFPIPRGLENTLAHLPSELSGESPEQLLALAKLGKRLFHDTVLSTNAQGQEQNVSCASCHDSARAFTDGRVRAQGVQMLDLNSPTLVNRLFAREQFFDKRSPSLFAQSQDPIVNPKEMNGHWPAILHRLSADASYLASFHGVFGDTIELKQSHVQKALTAFVVSMTSGDAPIDNGSQVGGMDVLKYNQGRALFFGKARCVACHNGGNFTDELLHNTGNGRAVKTPTLREIGKTAPYFHDGSAASLLDVVHFYNQPRTQDPNLDPEIHPIGLTGAEEQALVHFLQFAFEGRVDFQQ